MISDVGYLGNVRVRASVHEYSVTFFHVCENVHQLLYHFSLVPEIFSSALDTIPVFDVCVCGLIQRVMLFSSSNINVRSERGYVVLQAELTSIWSRDIFPSTGATLTCSTATFSSDDPVPLSLSPHHSPPPPPPPPPPPHFLLPPYFLLPHYFLLPPYFPP